MAQTWQKCLTLYNLLRTVMMTPKPVHLLRCVLPGRSLSGHERLFHGLPGYDRVRATLLGNRSAAHTTGLWDIEGQGLR